MDKTKSPGSQWVRVNDKKDFWQKICHKLQSNSSKVYSKLLLFDIAKWSKVLMTIFSEPQRHSLPVRMSHKQHLVTFGGPCAGRPGPDWRSAAGRGGAGGGGGRGGQTRPALWGQPLTHHRFLAGNSGPTICHPLQGENTCTIKLVYWQKNGCVRKHIVLIQSRR